MSFASIFGSLAGAGAAQPIDAVGNVIDKLFTSDEERLDKEALLARLAQAPALAQIELNKVEASHRTVFVAGWRPFIGWVAGSSLAMYYLPQFALATWLWSRQCLLDNQLLAYPIADISGITELVVALLGLGTLRTVEKLTNRAK
jgi:hypothetical protein